MRQKYPQWLLAAAAGALFIANTINVGADLGGMADAAHLLTGVPSFVWVLACGVGIAIATIRLRYAVIANTLKWLALILGVVRGGRAIGGTFKQRPGRRRHRLAGGLRSRRDVGAGADSAGDRGLLAATLGRG